MTSKSKKGAKIYFWLKFDKNFFENLSIKQARTLPGGDTMIVVYQKLMLEALASEGVLYYQCVLENIHKELALNLGETVENISMTLSYFVKAGLVQIDDLQNVTMLQVPAFLQQETDWAKYKREERERKRLDNVQKLSNTCPTEIEKDKELDKKLDLKLDIKSDSRELESKLADTADEATKINVYAYYQSRIGVLDGYQAEKLKGYLDIDDLEPDLVKRAIDRAADNSKRNFGYINAILKNWAQNGIKTIVQQDEEQRNFKDKADGSIDKPASDDIGV